jgi:predicted transcriptional regulator
MSVLSFESFLSEKAAAAPAVEKKFPKDFKKLVAEAAAKSREVKELAQKLSSAKSDLEAYDAQVMTKMEELGKSSDKVGKILVELEKKMSVVRPSYKEEFEAVYNKLFEVNRDLAMALMRQIEGARKLPELVKKVKYVGEAESFLAKVGELLKGWYSSWKKAIFGASDKLEKSVSELDAAVEKIGK